jgi:hypothetical protein
MLRYEMKAHPTRYRGTLFRSRLEATWAAFADIAGWKWKYEPVDLKGWTPDFWFGIPCGHSECCGYHIKQCPKCRSKKWETFEYVPDIALTQKARFGFSAYSTSRRLCLGCQARYDPFARDPNYVHELYAEVKPYASLTEFKSHAVTKIDRYTIPSPAMFGIDPTVTEWEMAHGAGGGIESVVNGWAGADWEFAWAEAGNRTRYRGPV